MQKETKNHLAALFLIFCLAFLVLFAASCTFSVGTENGKFVSSIKGCKSVQIDTTEYILDTITGCYCPKPIKEPAPKEPYHHKH